jgi:hypothetical protein
VGTARDKHAICIGLTGTLKRLKKMKNDNTIMLAIAVYAAAMTLLIHMVAIA